MTFRPLSTIMVLQIQLTLTQVHISQAAPLSNLPTDIFVVTKYISEVSPPTVTITTTECAETNSSSVLDSVSDLPTTDANSDTELLEPLTTVTTAGPPFLPTDATLSIAEEPSTTVPFSSAPTTDPITITSILVGSSTIVIQSAPTVAEPGTSGSIHSTLDTTEPVPIPTGAILPPSGTLSPISDQRPEPTVKYWVPASMSADNIFTPISGDALVVPSNNNHPVPRDKIANQTNRIPTNKFYANLFLGSQGSGCWTHPYSITWSKGGYNAKSWGLSISLIERSMLALGPVKQPQNAAQYFVNPVGIQSVILSATELGNATSLTVETAEAFSANANLAPFVGAAPVITFPLVQGMGFVTAVYRQGCNPLIQSSVFFRTFTHAETTNNGATHKYRIVLEDNSNWLAYVTSTGGPPASQFNMTSNTAIKGPGGFQGYIQIAKNNQDFEGEAVYDKSAGVYATSGSISAGVNGNAGKYSLSWKKEGNTSLPLLMHALTHHVQSFDGATAGRKTAVRLQTTTKGLTTGVLADRWDMSETLPVNMGFAPWSPSRGSANALSSAASAAINKVAAAELNQDINAQTNLDSMYFSGKALAKFAAIIYAVHELARNPGLAAAGLYKLEQALARFVNNTQINPLNYDNVWGGVVSTAGYANAGADFGNTYYNDHHFHYGYHVYAAAVIAYLNPSWLTQGKNKAWVNMLVRDFANSVTGTQFPFSRAFDWFHGHSWAKGLFESADGKDQESTSEDSFASYAMKMWGHVIGDANMEARGNLMLAIQARSFQSYFLMESSNTVQPPQFIGNKVTGILFENKVDHATYFGMNTEYIEGIHMIPLAPPSALTRTQNFVREEWNTYFSNGRVDQTGGGWRGILYANLAIIDPVAAWNFFNQHNFDPAWLDGGASRTWYLAYAAGLGGA